MALTASSSFQSGLRREKREAAQAFRFESAHGSARKPAQFELGSLLALPPPRSNSRFAFNFAGLCSSVVSKVLPVTSPPAITSAAASLTAASEVSIETWGAWFFLAAGLFSFVEHDGDQAFGFNFRRIGEGKIGFHDCV